MSSTDVHEPSLENIDLASVYCPKCLGRPLQLVHGDKLD
jgi:Zn finger protein HypA/HybF involved in hydrogenase expression